jgi:hypothetical protein
VIIVDGQAVNSPGPGGEDSRDPEVIVRNARLELRLCKALAALRPPHDVSVLVHARTAELLRKLRQCGAVDEDVAEVADLSDGELKEAAGIVRAFRALPSWRAKGFQGGASFRAVFGEYALDLADELDTRAGRDQRPPILSET